MADRNNGNGNVLHTASLSVIGVQENIVTINISTNNETVTSLMRNEVVYIFPTKKNSAGKQEKLKGEVLRIMGETADVQVYEDTRGVTVGDFVEQTNELLSVELGPGILSQVYDGLQNPLERLAIESGRFLQRGVVADALDLEIVWGFSAVARLGDSLRAGGVIGTVQEGKFIHKIMVPFALEGKVTVSWIQEGSFTANTVIAKVTDEQDREHALTMIQKWPVRVALPSRLLSSGLCERQLPTQPMITTLRLVDTFFPIALGGTGCIPGPFGAGKTVLQQLISRYSNVDIVIVVACGERAGEVVETIKEFPNLQDPYGGGSLMDRTVIICNTSSMPVAAREASIYTGMTLGEYYRQMGLNVLLLADSTSRWAQAMRERSGRLEEIPGEEAFPAYLESSIKNLYERAGIIKTNDGQVGSLTMIGTVSPAGGNFEEPVTQATLNTVKTFLGLSADRAYKRFYPAVDPLLSWSRYLDQLAPWYHQHLGGEWSKHVQDVVTLLEKGDAVFRMMQVTGEEGVSLSDFVSYQKALFVDMVYLQQDAYDDVDVSTSLERQKEVFELLYMVTRQTTELSDKTAVRQFYTKLTSLFKDMNYSVQGSDAYLRYREQIQSEL